MTAHACDRRRPRGKPRDEWLALKPGAHEGYVDWERAEAIRKMVSDNVPDEPASRRAQARRRAARRPAALPPLRSEADLPLHRHEARHSALRLPSGAARQWRTALHRLRRIAGRRRHRGGPARRSSSRARSRRHWPPRRRTSAARTRFGQALSRDLEAARYAAERAFRQYDAADPENRLVAGELEARWNRGACARRRGRAKIAAMTRQHPCIHRATPSSFATLAADLEAVWCAPTTDARLKKRIVRTVIQEVVADIDDAAAEIVLLVHWMGGIHTELRLPRRRRGQRNSTSPDIVAAVRLLVRIANDDLIAGILNRNGLRTGHGNRWTRERVTSLRSHHRIPVWRPAADGVEPWLNLTRAAKLLGISQKTLRLAAESGEIDAVHPLPDGPWIFSRADILAPAAQTIVDRARRGARHPTGPHPEQQSLFSSTT